MKLEFDPVSHTYRVNGVVVPHVTGILSPLVDLSKIPPDALERARQEGVAVHKMVELDCAGTLDVDALPEWMRPVYRAWQEFKAMSGFVPVLSEFQGYSPTFGYAGTLDLVCELPNLRDWPGAALLDVKRSLLAGPVIGLQTAAYEALIRSDKAMPRIRRRGALRLNKDGKLRLEPFDDPSDFTVFSSLLTIHKWKEKHGLQ